VRKRALSSLPLLVVAMLLAHVTQSSILAIVDFVACAVAIPLAGQLDAQPLVQRLTLAAVAIVVAAGGGTFFLGPDLDLPSAPAHWLGVVAVTTLLLALTRRFFLAPEGEEKPDIALLSIALLACGQKHVGIVFFAAVALFVAAIVLVFRSRDGSLGWSVVEAHSLRALSGIIGLTALLGAAAIFALPRLAALTQKQFDHFVVPMDGTHTGFTDRLRLGLPDPLLQSETLVLRVYGPHTDYLRGRVYDRYDRGVWESSGAGEVRHAAVPGAPRRGGASTEVRTVSPGAVPLGQGRYFVPLAARDVGTPSGALVVDPTGTFRPDREAPRVVFFEAGAAQFPAAPPGESDLRVPANLLPILEPLVAEWARGADNPEDKLLAIERRLRDDFTYSLEPDMSGHQEPAIVHFLLHSRRGHCEYFATALALLARVVGIPARTVGGYRVAEHNGLGGYDVVREKNAHAWVEAWMSSGAEPAWSTLDPTPMTEANMRRDTVRMAGALDATAAAWDVALDAVGCAQPWQFAVGLGLAIALLVLVRALRARRAARLHTADVGDAPLLSFAALEAALAALGHARPSSEPLESFARRLADAGQEDAASVVLEYGALRYGGIGSDAEVAASLLRTVARLSPPSQV